MFEELIRLFENDKKRLSILIKERYGFVKFISLIEKDMSFPFDHKRKYLRLLQLYLYEPVNITLRFHNTPDKDPSLFVSFYPYRVTKRFLRNVKKYLEKKGKKIHIFCELVPSEEKGIIHYVCRIPGFNKIMMSVKSDYICFTSDIDRDCYVFYKTEDFVKTLNFGFEITEMLKKCFIYIDPESYSDLNEFRKDVLKILFTKASIQ